MIGIAAKLVKLKLNSSEFDESHKTEMDDVLNIIHFVFNYVCTFL